MRLHHRIVCLTMLLGQLLISDPGYSSHGLSVRVIEGTDDIVVLEPSDLKDPIPASRLWLITKKDRSSLPLLTVPFQSLPPSRDLILAHADKDKNSRPFLGIAYRVSGSGDQASHDQLVVSRDTTWKRVSLEPQPVNFSHLDAHNGMICCHVYGEQVPFHVTLVSPVDTVAVKQEQCSCEFSKECPSLPRQMSTLLLEPLIRTFGRGILDIIGYCAVILCVLISGHAAYESGEKNGRLFSSLVLLTTGWAVLLPYYSSNATDEFLAGMSGLMFVFSGRALRREANFRAQESERRRTEKMAPDSGQPPPIAETTQIRGSVPGVPMLDRWAVLLFVALSVPHLMIPAKSFALFESIHPRLEIVLVLAVTLAGYLSFTDGIVQLAKDFSSRLVKGLKITVIVVMIIYALVEILFFLWKLKHPSLPMNDEFILLFAGLKLAATMSSCWIITMAAHELDNGRGLMRWLLRDSG